MNHMDKQRRARDWSRAKLARVADMNATTISEAVSGKRRPGPMQLAKIARALEWTGRPEALLDEVDDDGAVRE
jgi:transcriptional regulator with XRE-family HTH domain